MDAIVYDKVGKEAEKVRDALYGIYPQETITNAAIASFDDGADGIPVKALTVGIEPVQNLHGYDHPWPGGGGKNRYNPDNAQNNSWVRNDGTIQQEVPNYWITGFIPVKAGDIVRCPPKGSPRNAWYNSDKSQATYFGDYSGTPSDSNVGATAPEDGYVVLTVFGDTVAYGADFIVTINNEDLTYSPYSNSCPISGWTGAEIPQRGKNLFGGVYNVFFPLHFNVDTQVTASADTRGGSGNIQIAFYDSNQSQIDYWGLDTEGARDKKTFTYPATAYYVKFIRTESTNYQIELGSTASAYEEYRGNKISVNWETEAGTVYGGTLTLNPDRTGTLVVDMAVYDGGNLEWQKITESNYRNFVTTPTNHIAYSNSETTVWSSAYKGTNNNAASASEDCYTWANAILPNNMIAVKDTSKSNLSEAEFKAAMTGIQFMCKLMYPVTHQLTAEQVSDILTTLYGTNNIWADTGNIEKLTYRADLGKYIDSHITTAIANALNA